MAESSEPPAVAALPTEAAEATENTGQHVEVDDQVDDGDSAFEEAAWVDPVINCQLRTLADYNSVFHRQPHSHPASEITRMRMVVDIMHIELDVCSLSMCEFELSGPCLRKTTTSSLLRA